MPQDRAVRFTLEATVPLLFRDPYPYKTVAIRSVSPTEAIVDLRC